VHRLAALLLVALGLAACGGGSDPDKPSPARREFVRDLDVLCGQTNRLVARGNARLKRAQSSARSERAVAREVAAIIRDLLPRFRAIENRIRTLDAPPGENGFAAGYLTYTEQINDLFAASGEAAAQNDIQSFESLGARSQAVASKRAKLVKRHGGFKQCGREAAARAG
jgi:hypothetical protein